MKVDAVRRLASYITGFAKLSFTMSLLLIFLVSCSTFIAILAVLIITDGEAGHSEKKLDKRMEV